LKRAKLPVRPTKWVRTGEATGFLMDAPLGVVEVKGRVPAEGNP
jgi:hypothetical protein